MFTFNIVKKHIDCLDRMGLLAMGAPTDEYDVESRMISELITKETPVDEIANVISDVFARMFNQKENKDTYKSCAQNIHEDLNG